MREQQVRLRDLFLRPPLHLLLPALHALHVNPRVMRVSRGLDQVACAMAHQGGAILLL